MTDTDRQLQQLLYDLGEMGDAMDLPTGRPDLRLWLCRRIAATADRAAELAEQIATDLIGTPDTSDIPEET